MARLQEYEAVVGKNVIGELRLLGERLKGRIVQNINSTAVGGGVAEILSYMVPLLRELGVDARWDVIKGGGRFFQVTKAFHNALHGRRENITPEMLKTYLDTTQENLASMDIYGDIVFVHDPQPAGLIEKKSQIGKKWIWRCHIDISFPDQEVWDFIRQFVLRYDGAVFSAPSFAQELPIRQFLISPSIDPLDDKNKELNTKTIDGVLERFNIPKDKPIITQISRFDYLKDPVGVIKMFKLVKRYNPCRLVLAGGTATDDPESDKVLAEVREEAGDDPLIHILPIPSGSDIEINALQRASTIILQKSIKEGFGLTVTEALWKGKPVVAGAVGGIPLQIRHRYSGLLCHTVEGAAHLVKQLLNSPEYAKKLGENGRAHVRQNFLLTRHLKEYMLMFLTLDYNKDVIYL